MNEKNQCFKGWETLVSNIWVFLFDLFEYLFEITSEVFWINRYLVCCELLNLIPSLHAHALDTIYLEQTLQI